MSPTAVTPIGRLLACAGCLLLLVPPVAAQPFPARVPLSGLDAASGFVLRGVQALDEAGKSVSRAGDWNGDGIDDLLLGAPSATRNNIRWIGESYVVFGSGTTPGEPVWLADLNGSNGVTFLGVYIVAFTGMSVSDVGDINHDGIDDILIGAGIASPDFIAEIGESYVVFGTRDALPASIALSQLNAATGFRMRGLQPPERMGTSVSGAGDFNGDGVLDFVMGASAASPENRNFAGVSSVVFGAQGAPQTNLALLDGSNGLVIQGLFPGDFLGNGVSNAGDFNGDGFDDLVLGAPRSNRDGVNRIGEAYVVYGGNSNPAARSVLGLNGSNGFALMGSTGSEEMGFLVSAAGDVNNDGYADVLVAAPFANRTNRPQAGEVVLLFGSDAPWPAVMSAGGITSTQGRVIRAPEPNAQLGYGVGAAGDINDDGVEDFILGAPLSSPGGRYQAGVAYVLFGVDGAFPEQVDLATLDGSNGFVIEGVAAGDRCGWSVSGAGDVNNDGIDDLVIGAPSATRDGRGSSGEVYVLFGRSSEVAIDLADFSVQAAEGGVLLRWCLRGTSLRDTSQLQVQRRRAQEQMWQTVSGSLLPGHDMQYEDDLATLGLVPQDGDVLWYRLLLTSTAGKVSASAALQVVWSQETRTFLGTSARTESGVRIHYALGNAAMVQLKIYDVSGRQVHAFAPQWQARGAHVQLWDTRNGAASRAVSPGVYLVHLKAGSYAAARKVVLTRD